MEDDIGKKIITRFTYWDNGQSQDHYEYENGILTYRTIINSIRLENEKLLVLRLEEINGQLIPITHLVMNSSDSLRKLQQNSIPVM